MAERGKHAAEIARRALEIGDAAAREAHLREACGQDAALRREVDALLGAGVPESMQTAAEPARSGPGGTGATGAFETPEVIGRCRVIEKLGEGGFGVVYRAEQTEPVRREVAVKLIKPGMDSAAVVARFEQERQALAVMDHPNVARVLDGGATERGLPYFVMEYVRGDPITEFCDAQRKDVRERIGLFIQVCAAVQHAHSKGIIHRDLKPSNILVGYDGEGRARVKVIDFGIAKALQDRLVDSTIHTQRGMLIGTPEYTSPEQASLSGIDVDTRTDIYSLGVVLYELLTGTLPFDSRTLRGMSIADLQRVIREEDPPRPSTRVTTAEGGATSIEALGRVDREALTRELRGELDWVVMKCLEKDRARRYETPDALAAELRRYLDDEPVLARPPTARYRLGKFIRRRRGPVAAGVAIVLLLVAGVIGTTMFALRATAAAERARVAEAEAQRRAEEMERIAAFQESQLAGISVEEMGDRLRADVLERGLSALGDSAEDSATLERALERINFTNIALGSLEAGIFDRALEAVREDFADQPVVRARLLGALGDAMYSVGLLDGAEAPLREALEIRRRELGDAHPDTLMSLNNLGFLLRLRGDLDGAEPYWTEALAGRRAALGEDHPHTLLSVSNMAFLHRLRGEYEEAERYAQEALEGRRAALGDEHPETLVSVRNLGYIRRAQGDEEEAERLLTEAVEGNRRVLGETDSETVLAMKDLASLRVAQGRLEEAEAGLRAALAAARRGLGDLHPDTQEIARGLAVMLGNQGRMDEAEPFYRLALEGARRRFGADHARTLGATSNMAFYYAMSGRQELAEPMFRDVLSARRRTLGDRAGLTLLSVINLGATLNALERHAEARALLERSEPIVREEWRETQVGIMGNYLLKLGEARIGVGDRAGAEPVLLEAHALMAEGYGADHARTRGCAATIAAMYESWEGGGREAQAAEWRERAG